MEIGYRATGLDWVQWLLMLKNMIWDFV